MNVLIRIKLSNAEGFLPFSHKDGVAAFEHVSVLGAAYVLGVGVVELFCKPVSKLFADGMRRCPEPVRENHSAHSKRYSRQTMEAVLDRVLAENASEPPSLSAVALKVGCHMTRLVALFPEKTDAIKTAHQNWIQSRKLERQAMIEREIREAVLKIHARGFYPSSCRVKASVPTYADLRSVFARAVWKKALAELGYSVQDISAGFSSASETKTV